MKLFLSMDDVFITQGEKTKITITFIERHISDNLTFHLFSGIEVGISTKGNILSLGKIDDKVIQSSRDC